MDTLLLCNINESVRFYLLLTITVMSHLIYFLMLDLCGFTWTTYVGRCQCKLMYLKLGIRNCILVDSSQLKTCKKYTEMLQKLFHGYTTLCHPQDSPSEFINPMER